MWMSGIRPTKIQHFAVTVDSHLLIFTTVMSEMALHQPCFSMVGIYVQNMINKDLCNFPTFFGDRSCRM